LPRGEALLPANVRQLLNTHAEKVRCCFLGYSDTTPERKVNAIKTYRTLKNDWLLNEPDATIFEHVTHMINYSAFIRQECRANDLPYFDVSQDFRRTLDDAIRTLTA
jgi:hypothetical protein